MVLLSHRRLNADDPESKQLNSVKKTTRSYN